MDIKQIYDLFSGTLIRYFLVGAAFFLSVIIYFSAVISKENFEKKAHLYKHITILSWFSMIGLLILATISFVFGDIIRVILSESGTSAYKATTAIFVAGIILVLGVITFVFTFQVMRFYFSDWMHPKECTPPLEKEG